MIRTAFLLLSSTFLFACADAGSLQAPSLELRATEVSLGTLPRKICTSTCKAVEPVCHTDSNGNYVCICPCQ